MSSQINVQERYCHVSSSLEHSSRLQDHTLNVAVPFHVARLQTVQQRNDRMCLDPILFCFYRNGVRRRREDGGSAQRKGVRIGAVLCLKSMCWKLLLLCC